jgi:CDP-diacylglycerol--glycerol-3-phosphate 3-phosphatidyltransferase
MSTTATPPRPPIVNLPNILTSSRFVLALVLFGLITFELWLWCLVVFAAAAVTDWLDGYLARKQGLTSTLGRNLDPLVDKVLMCGAFVFLLPVPSAMLAPWMVVVVVARELIITGLRGFLEGEGVTFGADWLGKIKMVLQCAALIGIFVVLRAEADRSEHLATLRAITFGLIYGMVAATALSGLQYLWKAALLLRRD